MVYNMYFRISILQCAVSENKKNDKKPLSVIYIYIWLITAEMYVGDDLCWFSNYD